VRGEMSAAAAAGSVAPRESKMKNLKIKKVDIAGFVIEQSKL